MTDCDDLSEPGILLDAVGSLSSFVSLANQKGCFADVLTDLVREVKGMNTWLTGISSDVAVQGEMLAKLRTDRGCKVCRENIERSLAEVESADDIQESQKPSTFYW